MDHHGNTVLHWAAGGGHVEILGDGIDGRLRGVHGRIK